MSPVIFKAEIACSSEGALSLLTQFGLLGQGANWPCVSPIGEPVPE